MLIWHYIFAGVTTMLNFFTTSNGFRSTLPVVSNLTAMNVWDGVCMCFIYASLLEFVCVNYVGRKRPLHNVVYRPGENPVTQVMPIKHVNNCVKIKYVNGFCFSALAIWFISINKKKNNNNTNTIRRLTNQYSFFFSWIKLWFRQNRMRICFPLLISFTSKANYIEFIHLTLLWNHWYLMLSSNWFIDSATQTQRVWCNVAKCKEASRRSTIMYYYYYYLCRSFSGK